MSHMDSQVRTETLIKCSDCGKSDTVPFKPDPSRPVYCRVCHNRRRDFAKGESSDKILRATSRVVYDASWGKEGESKQ
jgi:CxxC-x17-CxxC domain-containing protein